MVSLKVIGEITMAYPEKILDVKKSIQDMEGLSPRIFHPWKELENIAFAGGQLDGKTKRIIALSLAIMAHCKNSIGMHIEALVHLGLTQEELAELLAVLLCVGGATAHMMSLEALRAFEQYHIKRNVLEEPCAHG